MASDQYENHLRLAEEREVIANFTFIGQHRSGSASSFSSTRTILPNRRLKTTKSGFRISPTQRDMLVLSDTISS